MQQIREDEGKCRDVAFRLRGENNGLKEALVNNKKELEQLKKIYDNSKSAVHDMGSAFVAKLSDE